MPSEVLRELILRLAEPDRLEVEAACLMLGMADDRRDWKPKDYAAALRERFGGNT